MIHLPPLEGDLSQQWCSSLLHLQAKFLLNQSQPAQGHAPVQVRYSAPAVSGGLHTETMCSVHQSTLISGENSGVEQRLSIHVLGSIHMTFPLLGLHGQFFVLK